MTLGPTKLDPTACNTILAEAQYAIALQNYAAQTIEWGHSSLAPLKLALRLSLRGRQERRCIYCRRIMLVERRNTAEDIEHFLDKSKDEYYKWSFESCNLALACHPCNFEKSTRNLGSAAIGASANYVLTPGAYRWIHPYFDEYHANILIGKGWTYCISAAAPVVLQAQQMIADCKLGDIEQTEAYAEAIKNEIYRLICEAGAAMRSQNYALAQMLNAECKLYQEENWFNF